MKLIFAQGNPGSQYAKTRHNVGFVIADTLAAQLDTNFKTAGKFFADIAELTISSEKVIIAKPSTFYNETGQSLNAIKQFYKLDNTDILIIHDELALPLGTLRSRIGGSDAGNNGIKSINTHGGTDTSRLRVGIGSELHTRMSDADFVLGHFSKDECTVLSATVLPAALKIVTDFINNDFKHTTHT